MRRSIRSSILAGLLPSVLAFGLAFGLASGPAVAQEFDPGPMHQQVAAQFLEDARLLRRWAADASSGPVGAPNQGRRRDRVMEFLMAASDYPKDLPLDPRAASDRVESLANAYRTAYESTDEGTRARPAVRLADIRLRAGLEQLRLLASLRQVDEKARLSEAKRIEDDTEEIEEDLEKDEDREKDRARRDRMKAARKEVERFRIAADAMHETLKKGKDASRLPDLFNAANRLYPPARAAMEAFDAKRRNEFDAVGARLEAFGRAYVGAGSTIRIDRPAPGSWSVTPSTSSTTVPSRAPIPVPNRPADVLAPAR